MKAKVRNTGEIVDVHPIGEKIIHLRCTNFATGDGRELLDMEFEFLPTIDWEQRRYEIAKGIISKAFNQYVKSMSAKDFTNICLQWADALIEELKKTSK